MQYNYFLSGTHIGTGEVSPPITARSSTILNFWHPHSWFIYCPKCGDIWARGFSSKPETEHLALKACCAEHGGGSLLMLAQRKDLEELPCTKAFALYELNLFNLNPKLYNLRTPINQN